MTIIQWDEWNNLFDKSNKPLLGRILFKDKDTHKDIDVFDNAGNNLGNIVYINGVTDYQIFVDVEHNYTAYLYQYIGTGSFREDEDESDWLLIRTIDKLNKLIDVTEHDDIVYGIEALKSIDTTNKEDNYTVIVVGYHEADDCPPRTYRWSKSSTATVDNGIIVGNQNQTGRWILNIPYDYIDVRWYGDIPQQTYYSGTSYTANRAAAAQACDNYNKALYFPTGYYIFDGSNSVSPYRNIIVDNDVSFYFKSSNTTTIHCKDIIGNGCSGPLLLTDGNQNIALYVKTARTSWAQQLNFDPIKSADKYIIDSSTSSKMVIKGQFETSLYSPVSGISFVNAKSTNSCYFIKSSCSFKNMTVDGHWFVDNNYQSGHTFENCKLTDAGTFLNKKLYIQLMNQMNNPVYGDIQNADLTDTTLLDNAVISNFTGSVTLSGNATIDKCYGTVNLKSGSKTSIKNSHCTISGVADVLNIENCTIFGTFNAKTNVFDSNLVDCTLTTTYMKLDNDSITNSNITINPTDKSYVYFIRSCSFTGSTIYEKSSVVGCIREAIVLNNNGLVLNDDESNTTKLGQSFIWKNNNDGWNDISTTGIEYIGYDHSQTNVPNWSDYQNAMYIRDNNDDRIVQWGFAQSNSGGNMVFDSRILLKCTINMPEQPFKYPANAGYIDVKIDTKWLDSISTSSTPLMVVRNMQTIETDPGVKYYSILYCGRTGVPLVGNVTANLTTTPVLGK